MDGKELTREDRERMAFERIDPSGIMVRFAVFCRMMRQQQLSGERGRRLRQLQASGDQDGLRKFDREFGVRRVGEEESRP